MRTAISPRLAISKRRITWAASLEDAEAAQGAEVLVSRLRSSLSFSGRGIPPGGVAPPSHTPGMLGRRAWPAGRRAAENQPRNFWDVTLPSLFRVLLPIGLAVLPAGMPAQR